MNLRITEILKKKKITQSELANRLGITRQSLGIKIKSNISIKELNKVSKALGVEVHELIELSDNYEHIYNENGDWKGILKKCKK